MDLDAEDEVVSLSRDGKRLLRAAFEVSGKSLSELARRLGCSHPHVRTLLGDETTLGSSSQPTWSSRHVPGLCRELGVPLWAVVSGLRPEHRRLIEALERVRELAPDKYDAFVDAVIEQAEDKAARAGWVPEGDPPPAGRRRPPLRPVR